MSFSIPELHEWFSKTPPDKTRRLQKKGTLLFLQGDPSEIFWIIREGRILILKESPQGEPVVLERLQEGDFVGGFAVIGDFPYPATAVSDCPTVLIGYAKDRIQKLLRNNPVLHQSVLKELGHRVQNLQSALLFSTCSLEVRLSRALCSLSQHKAKVPAPAAGPVSIAITRQTLARMAQTTVESTIRTTKVWEREGKLDLSRRGVIRILDLKFFHSLAEEYGSFGG